MSIELNQIFDRLTARIGPIGAEARAAFVGACRSRTFAAGHHFFRAGEMPQEIVLLGRGLVRLYYVTRKGRTFNKAFIDAGGSVGSMVSVSRREPVRFFAEALEEGAGFWISADTLHGLYGRYPALGAAGRLFAEELAIKKEQREAELLLDSPEQRYMRLIAERPELARRLPLFHIAAYLGITDVALSRIRRRIKRNGGTLSPTP